MKYSAEMVVSNICQFTSIDLSIYYNPQVRTRFSVNLDRESIMARRLFSPLRSTFFVRVLVVSV